MRKLWLIGVAVIAAACMTVFAQEEPAPEPAPAGEKQADPPAQEQPKPDDGKIVVYIEVGDKVDGEPYKWRATEYTIKRTFELANPDFEEKFKDEWRKRFDWSGYSKQKKEKKLDKDYQDLRKEKGVSKLKYSHIKVISWRPRPKEEKEEGNKEEGNKEEEKGEGEKEEQAAPPEEPQKKDDETGKPEEKKPDMSGEEPVEPGEPAEKKPEKKPAKKKWVDPKTTADYIIIGEGNFKKGKKAKYFGETVAWNSIGEIEVSVIRREDQKVIKKFKLPPLKRSDTRGQDAAHLRCMRELGQDVATKIVNMPVFKAKK